MDGQVCTETRRRQLTLRLWNLLHLDARGMRALALITCVLGIAGMLAAQTEFEVASVKPARADVPYRGCRGGPGTNDPGYWTCTRAPLQWLIETAYDLPPYGVVRQSWMSQLEFDITAKVPAGTPKQRFRRMQQDLLVRRFHLQFHYEPKEMLVSQLTVAKPGMLPKAAVPIDRSDSFVPGPMSTLDGRRYWKVKDVSMDDLVQVLGLQLGGRDWAPGTLRCVARMGRGDAGGGQSRPANGRRDCV